jgi:hypothetical protein
MSSYDIDYRERKNKEAAILADANISNKMSAHHQQQFRERFPQQVEQILRLTAERLQNGLHKTTNDPLSNEDVRNLAIALQCIHEVYINR